MTKLVYLKHSPKTVALVGMGPSVQDLMRDTLTQEFKPEFADEVWAINMAANLVWHDVVFWMDDLDDQENYRPGLFKMLRRRGRPVITSRRHPEIVPHSYDYPIQEVAEIALKAFGKPYINNAVAAAIGYAIWKKVKTLRIYGADFTYPNWTHGESGRACVEAWMALASMSGMNLVIPPTTSLMDSVCDKGVYGYKEQPEIVMPDGSVMVHRMRSDGHGGNYVAEDSSRATPEPEPKTELGAAQQQEKPRVRKTNSGARGDGADPGRSDDPASIPAP